MWRGMEEKNLGGGKCKKIFFTDNGEERGAHIYIYTHRRTNEHPRLDFRRSLLNF